MTTFNFGDSGFQENLGMASSSSNCIEYMNLDCVSAAEREILQNMIFKNPSNPIIFEHLKPRPPPEGFFYPGGDVQFGGTQDHMHSGQSSRNEFEHGSSPQSQPHEFGVDPNIALNLSHHQNQNGPTVPVSSQGQHLLMEHHQMGQGQGPPQQAHQNYYPPGQMIHGGPTNPHSIQVPITVFHQQLAHRQQVLQASAGTFMNHPHHLNQLPHMTQQQYQQMGIQQMSYGMAAGAHSHPQQQSYGSGEDGGHMQKGHHEHTPGSPNSKGYRKQPRAPRRGEEGPPPLNQYAPPYYPGGYGMPPYGTTVYFAPPPPPGAIAQAVTNVTGQPLILPSSGQQQQGGLYPQYSTHMYPATSPGAELEHHVGPILHPSTIAQLPQESIQGMPQVSHPAVLSTLAQGAKVIQEFVPAAATAAGVPPTTAYEVSLGQMQSVTQGWTEPSAEVKTETEIITSLAGRLSTEPRNIQPVNSDTVISMPTNLGEDRVDTTEAKVGPITSLASVKSRIDEIKPFVPASTLIAQQKAQVQAQQAQIQVQAQQQQPQVQLQPQQHQAQMQPQQSQVQLQPQQAQVQLQSQLALVPVQSSQPPVQVEAKQSSVQAPVQPILVQAQPKQAQVPTQAQQAQVKVPPEQAKIKAPAQHPQVQVQPQQVAEVEVLKPNGPTQSAPITQKQGPSSNQSQRQNNVPLPVKKDTNPEFPQLALSNTNSNTNLSTSSNGQVSASTSATSLQPAKGRSWASIASSKQANNTNGPTNGIISADGSISNTSTSSANNVVTQSVIVPMSDIKSSSNPVPQIYSADPSFDPTCLSNENDPIALSLGEHLTNYVLNHHSLSLTPRGLSNQSNFCYINATLQSLIACPPFVNLFRSMKDFIGKKQCKATPIIQSVFDFVMEFEPITRLSQNSRHKRLTDAFFIGANFEPTGIRKVLGLLDGATFKVEGRQEDAEEFLSHLLNGLHDEMIKLMKWYEAKKDRLNAKPSAVVVETPVPAPAARNGDSEINEEDNDEWQVMGPKGKGSMTRKTDFSKSPISEMFLGQMSSLLNRTNTPKTTTLQPFFTLQLDIQDENINSVRDALDGLSTKEEVSCSANGQEVAIWKQLSLEVLPIILVLHMKRFVYDKSGNRIYKLDKKVDFGVDLEIGKDLLSVNAKAKYFNTKSRFYKLFAAVYHDGEEAHKGHYVADTFHPSGGSLWGQFGWIRYDDTTVKGVTENQILNQTPPRVPYLLYYRRVDTLSQAKKVQERGPERGSERGSYY